MYNDNSCLSPIDPKWSLEFEAWYAEQGDTKYVLPPSVEAPRALALWELGKEL